MYTVHRNSYYYGLLDYKPYMSIKGKRISNLIMSSSKPLKGLKHIRKI